MSNSAAAQQHAPLAKLCKDGSIDRSPIDFDKVVHAIFRAHRDLLFTALDGAIGDLRALDPEDIRQQLDAAIGEVAASMGLPDTVETLGDLADIVLEQEPALNEYLIETTDR